MKKKLSEGLVVSLVAGVCILGLAIVSKYFLDREMDFISQYGPAWMYIAYTICKGEEKETPRGTLFWSLAISIVTLAIIVVYAI